MLAGTAADTDGADDGAVGLQRDPAGEDHHPAVVGRVDAVELLTRLGGLGQVRRRDVKRPSGEGLVDRDVDTAPPCAVHPHVRDKVATLVDNGDIAGLAEFGRLRLTGLDDATRVGQGHGRHGQHERTSIFGRQRALAPGARASHRVGASCLDAEQRVNF